MAYYRLYRLSAPGGRFVGFEEIDASDDGAALARARELAGAKPMELWCGARKIGAVPAATEARTAPSSLAQGQ